ncbi:MAG TPA: ABC transporter permease [Cellulomonas sp.]
MRFARFLATRLGSLVVVLLVVSLLTYAIFVLLPADPAQLACGRPCTPERLATARSFMQLDRSFLEQWWDFLRGVFTGRTFGSASAQISCPAPCLGYSFRLNAPVTELIVNRFPVTASIAVGAAVLWLVAGVAGGVVAAVRRGTVLDRALMVGAITGVSAPSYLVGLLGILLFGFTLDMVPVSGYVPFTEDPVGWAWHLVLPWTVLALLSAAIYTRITRAQMLDALGSEYVRTARAKGISEGRVVTRHALRNVMVPVLTLFALDLGALLGGAVITERVFSMAGLGALLIEAVGSTDVPVLVGVTVFTSAIVVVANLTVDVVYGVLDPRVRTGRAA